jgi:hypothetical protein
VDRPDPLETARRVRAALAYADIKVRGNSEERFQIGEATMRRITSSTDPRGATIEELWRIADACGVPREFLLSGFGRYDEEEPVSDRVGALEDQVAFLMREIARER